MRLHFSAKPIKKTRTTVGSLEPGWKPVGLWYSCGSSWEDWASAVGFGGIGEYVYEVELNVSNMLFISTADELDKFTTKYAAPRSQDNSMFADRQLWNIDWEKVAQTYDGIEICPYIASRRHKYMWYYGWDVASGCLWNKNAIVNLTLRESSKSEIELNEEAENDIVEEMVPVPFPFFDAYDNDEDADYTITKLEPLYETGRVVVINLDNPRLFATQETVDLNTIERQLSGEWGGSSKLPVPGSFGPFTSTDMTFAALEIETRQKPNNMTATVFELYTCTPFRNLTIELSSLDIYHFLNGWNSPASNTIPP